MSSLTGLLCARLRQLSESADVLKEEEVCEVLRALLTSSMSVELLQSSRVGVLVNSLRRRMTGEGATLARRLVERWKAAVTAASAASAPPIAIAAAAALSPDPSVGPSPSPRKRRRSSTPSSPSPSSSSSSSLLSAAGHPLPLYTLADLPRPLSPSPSHVIGRSHSSASSSPPSPAPPSALPSSATALLLSSQGEGDLPLYNPNLHHFPLPPPSASLSTVVPSPAETGDEEDEAAYVGDVTSRRRTRAGGDDGEEEEGSGGLWAASLPPPPTHPVQVCSLVQMCVDRLSHPSTLTSLTSLGLLPAPLALQILGRATAEQLRRVEELNPHLREDTQPLWRALTVRRWGEEAALERRRAALGLTWRHVYDERLREKDERLQRLGLRLRAKGEEERRDKKERQAIKVMDVQQVKRSLQQQRGRGGGGRRGRRGTVDLLHLLSGRQHCHCRPGLGLQRVEDHSAVQDSEPPVAAAQGQQ